MKKNFKKVISSLLVAVMILTAAPLSGFVGLKLNLDWLDFSTKSEALAASGSCGENVTYTFNKITGLLTISGTGSMTDYSSYSSPFCDNSSIKTAVIENGVTSIGDGAFYGCKGLTKITIPDSVTSIDKSAFSGCTSLISITIPDSVTSIGGYAFYRCTSLTSITIPDSVTSIDGDVFANCTGLKSINVSPDNPTYCSDENGVLFNKSKSILLKYPYAGATSYSIPDSVTSIGDDAFRSCTGLTSITIPDSVTSIDDDAFRSCTGLTSITIPDSVTSIGDYAFSSCTGLTSINVSPDNPTYCSDENGVLFNKSKSVLLKYPDAGATSYSIPDSVTSIGDDAFSSCIGITSITIPDSVTSIGDGAFNECTSITSITIPDSVTSIDDDAFLGCTGLKSIVIGNGISYIGLEAFAFCYKLSSIVLPDKKIDMNFSAFLLTGYSMNLKNWYRGGLYIGKTLVCIFPFEKKLKIKQGTKYISNNAFCSFNDIEFLGTFLNSSKIESISLPDSVISIGDYAFDSCTSVKSITISNNVKSIGNYAFSNCTNLKSITIGKDLISIGDGAFNNTGYYNDLSNWENGVLYIDNYLIKANNKISGDYIVKSGTRVIADCAFEGCYNLNSITIPDSITAIGENAFYSVNNIKYSDNWYLTKMNGVGSPWGAKAVDAYIEDNLYYYDSSKELLVGCSPKVSGTVSIPKTVEEVGENCFSGCNQIKTLEFNSSVYFAETAVSGCANLQTLNASDNTVDGVVITQPKNNSQNNISISGSENGLGILFCNRDSNFNYTVPDYIDYICANAFANCADVEVTIPKSVRLNSIGENAFLYNNNYKNKSNWDKKVFSIGGYIISAEKDVEEVIINKSVEGIADKAFKGCRLLKKLSIDSGSALRFLGSRVFIGCTSFNASGLLIPESVETVGENIFYDEENISKNDSQTIYSGNTLVSVAKDCTELQIRDDTICIADGAFENCTELQKIVIPESVKNIGKNTFNCCTSLRTVEFKGKINCIGEKAFSDCISLSEIKIPESVKKIGSLAFFGCTKLEKFDVENGNDSYKSENGVLMSIDGKKIIQYPAAKIDINEYEVNDDTFVCDLAFYRCKNVVDLKIGNGVSYGNRNPFAACSAKYIVVGSEEKYLYRDNGKSILVSASSTNDSDGSKEVLSIPDTVTEIGSYAIYEHNELTKVIVPEGVCEIGEYAFYGCSSLTEINIPKSVTYIGENAFEDCLSLAKVTYDGSKSDWEKVIVEKGNECIPKLLGFENVSIVSEIYEVSVENISIKYNDTIKIHPKISAKGNPTYTVEFKSSDNKVIIVDENGNATAKGKGGNFSKFV